MQPFQVLLIRGGSRNQVANHAYDDGMVGRLVQHPIVVGSQRAGFDHDSPDDSQRAGNAGITIGQARPDRERCPSSQARDASRTSGIKKMNVRVDHGYGGERASAIRLTPNLRLSKLRA